MSAPVMLIDGAGLWFRAFHALPSSLRSPAGEQVNAVRGFTDMLAALIRREQPQRMVVCLDLDWRPQFRVDRLPDYKAHRAVPGSPRLEDAPEELAAQVPLIRELLGDVGIATAGADGYEADDVMATLAHREEHAPVVVVSGDRDLLQVVRREQPQVRVLYVGAGMSKAEMFDADDVAQRYGLPAACAGAAYTDLMILRGDPSDGLPGVPGIGAKTAARLIREFGSIAGLRSAVRDGAATAGTAGTALTARRRAALAEADGYVEAAAAVVPARRDAPVRWCPAGRVAGREEHDALPSSPAAPEALRAFAARLGLAGPVERLTDAMAQR